MSGWPLGSWLRQWLLWQQGLLLNFWFVFVVIIGILNTIVEIINFFIVIVVFTTTIIITVIIFVTTYIFSEGKCKCCRRRPFCQRCLPAVIFFSNYFFCIPLPIRLFPFQLFSILLFLVFFVLPLQLFSIQLFFGILLPI